MKPRRVEEIMMPYQQSVPLTPAVLFGERITDAVQRMVSMNLKVIVVMKRRKPIGMIRLEDAFRVLGLNTSSPPPPRADHF